MATTREHLAKMQKENRRLKTENAKLRRELRGQKPARKNGGRAAPSRPISERGRVREILRKAGILAELTPSEKLRAARWRALPEEKKQEVMRTLESTHFDPPLSETIIQDRG
ncbi:MAG: hypothetical protein HY327_01625 [Chloroflexi bacterium]|nr:hypothetical protein [Chloroflexota bacterium]